MNPESIIELTRQGEGLRIEFKLAQNKLSRDAFETICAFLNRLGGHLLLGVSDNGEITGIDEAVIPQIANIFKYRSLYSPGMIPELIERDVFKTIIPLIPISVTGNDSVPDTSHNARDAIIDSLIDQYLNEGVKQRLERIIELISEQGKIKSVAIANHLKVSQSTIERDLKLLKKLRIVIYEGSPKTGGYMLTEDFLNKLKS